MPSRWGSRSAICSADGSSGSPTLRFDWAWLAVGGLLVQVLLFSPLLAERIGADVGAAIYVAVDRRRPDRGRAQHSPLAGAGARRARRGPNLAAIIANGGVMPTTEAALATAGLSPADGFSNSAVLADPRLAPLTDVFALPAAIPLANVFSIGDVLIGVGIVLVVALGMRAARPGRDARTRGRGA